MSVIKFDRVNEQTKNLEKELILAAQQGSVGAFEQLINQVEAKMLSVAAGLAACPDEADDIYQDAMICAFKAMPGFRMESQFSTWLYRIVVNTAMSSKRKLKRQLSRFVSTTTASGSETELEYEKYSNGADPEMELHNEQLSKAINRALECLTDKERISFVLCHQQGFKISDAANVMQCSDGAVKSFLFRAREKMREQLAEYIR